MALRDPRDLLERRVVRVRKDLLVLPVGMASKVLSVSRAQPDLRVHLERMVIREKLESRVKREVKVTRANMVHQVQQVLRV